MNAQEAKELADKRSMDIAIDGPLRAIIKAVGEAAQDGKYSIINPFHSCGFKKSVPYDQQTLLVRKLRSMGYEYKFLEDPDPGHPCSNAYEELSW